MANQAHIWTQGPNGIVLTCSTSSKDPKCTRLTNEFSSQLSQNWLYTEKSNFDFLVKIKCQDSFFIKTCQIMKLVHQEITKCKLGLEIRIFHNLEFFEVIKNPNFFLTLPHFFTKIHLDSNKRQNMKVVVCCIIYNFDSQSFPIWGLYLKL